MNQDLILHPIGKVILQEDRALIQLEKSYIPALLELDGFSHVQILWWFDGCGDEVSRRVLQVDSPYQHGPRRMGVFATRSPQRPNPLALSVAGIVGIDHTQGVISLTHIDAHHQSPVVDLKPYTPSLDRVAQPQVPAWCSHWPRDLEASGAFNWENEFNF